MIEIRGGQIRSATRRDTFCTIIQALHPPLVEILEESQLRLSLGGAQKHIRKLEREYRVLEKKDKIADLKIPLLTRKLDEFHMKILVPHQKPPPFHMPVVTSVFHHNDMFFLLTIEWEFRGRSYKDSLIWKNLYLYH